VRRSAFPETTVDFLHKHNQWTATPLVKTEALGERVLTAERVYVVDVEFHLPESAVNAHMGNWMVQVCVGGESEGKERDEEEERRACVGCVDRMRLCSSLTVFDPSLQVDLLTKDDKLLGRSVRPLILRYRSRIVRVRSTG
jgi:hypothetical protein